MHHISQGFYQFQPVANLASSIKSSIGRVFFQSWGGFDLAVTVCAGQVMRGMNLTVTALGFRRTGVGVRGLDLAGILSSYPRFLYYLRFLTGAASIASIFSVNVAQWHQMTAFERAAAQMKGLRCSFPPYFVAAMTPAGWPVAAMSGNTYEMLERGFAPSAEEAKMTLFRLRQKLRWSRAGMAAFIGVSQSVLRRWETGRTSTEWRGAAIDLATGFAGA